MNTHGSLNHPWTPVTKLLFYRSTARLVNAPGTAVAYLNETNIPFELYFAQDGTAVPKRRPEKHNTCTPVEALLFLRRDCLVPQFEQPRSTGQSRFRQKIDTLMCSTYSSLCFRSKCTSPCGWSTDFSFSLLGERHGTIDVSPTFTECSNVKSSSRNP